MRILFINDFFSNFGGSEKIVYHQAMMLKQNGHHVFFFSTDKKPYFFDNYPYVEYFPAYQDYHNLSTIDFIKKLPVFFYNKQAEHNLTNLIKKINPDLIHCHVIHFNLTPSVLKACYNAGLPVLMSLHDSRIICPNGMLVLKDNSYCNKLYCIGGNPIKCIQNKCREQNLIKSLLFSAEFYYRSIHKLYNKVNMLTCPSEPFTELVKKSYLKNIPTVTLLNFIDDIFLNNVPNYENHDYFLYVGRLSYEKGVDILLNASEKLPDIKFYIAGDGKDGNIYREYVKNNNLKNVHFLGRKSPEELFELYNGCKALILPSNCFETFGIALIEAFSFGKPVIGSNIGGIADVIDDGLNGLLFEVGNFDELAFKIEYLDKNPQIAAKMGLEGRKKLDNFYTSNIHYNKLIAIYETLLNNKT